MWVNLHPDKAFSFSTSSIVDVAVSIALTLLCQKVGHSLINTTDCHTFKEIEFCPINLDQLLFTQKFYPKYRRRLNWAQFSFLTGPNLVLPKANLAIASTSSLQFHSDKNFIFCQISNISIVRKRSSCGDMGQGG